MNENQNIEWKESWRDEYLKWICGFANATGGKIYIGVDDRGQVVGVTDARKLLEDIPNKVRDVLGIIVDVNLLEKNGLEYIEIDIPSYSNPINYKGQYHYRSGSTKQELKGAALNHFILGEFYQFNLSSCIRQQNSLTAQFVSFSLSNLANIFYPPPNFYNN